MRPEPAVALYFVHCRSVEEVKDGEKKDVAAAKMAGATHFFPLDPVRTKSWWVASAMAATVSMVLTAAAGLLTQSSAQLVEGSQTMLRLGHATLQCRGHPRSSRILSIGEEDDDDGQDDEHAQHALMQLCQIDKEIHKINAELEHRAADNEEARTAYLTRDFEPGTPPKSGSRPLLMNRRCQSVIPAQRSVGPSGKLITIQAHPIMSDLANAGGRTALDPASHTCASPHSPAHYKHGGIRSLCRAQTAPFKPRPIPHTWSRCPRRSAGIC